MKVREQRWPSSWAFELRTREARFIVRITNISASGLRFDGAVNARAGQTVKFKVLEQIVSGRIMRINSNGGAVAFDQKINATQLSILRQCRAISDV